MRVKRAANEAEAIRAIREHGFDIALFVVNSLPQAVVDVFDNKPDDRCFACNIFMSSLPLARTFFCADFPVRRNQADAFFVSLAGFTVEMAIEKLQKLFPQSTIEVG